MTVAFKLSQVISMEVHGQDRMPTTIRLSLLQQDKPIEAARRILITLPVILQPK
jgi:hypothetical protein